MIHIMDNLLIFQDIFVNQEIPIKLLNKIKKKYNVTIIEYFFNNIKSDNIFLLENLTFNDICSFRLIILTNCAREFSLQ